MCCCALWLLVSGLDSVGSEEFVLILSTDYQVLILLYFPRYCNGDVQGSEMQPPLELACKES